MLVARRAGILALPYKDWAAANPHAVIVRLV
jgi:hypothetical protein